MGLCVSSCQGDVKGESSDKSGDKKDGDVNVKVEGLIKSVSEDKTGEAKSDQEAASKARGGGRQKKTPKEKRVTKKERIENMFDKWWLADVESKDGTSASASLGPAMYVDDKMIAKLKEIDVSSLPKYTCEGKLILTRIALHDGDTGTICVFETDGNTSGLTSTPILFTSTPFGQPLRFFGVDAPEITLKTNDKPSNKELERRELEKRAGLHVLQQANKWIHSLHPHGLVWVKFAGEDKYGTRKLGKVYVAIPGHEHTPSGTEPDLVKWLLDKQYVKAYMGEAKVKWTRSELNLILGT